MELYYYLRYLVESFAYDQKMRSVSYLMDNEYEIAEDPSILETSNTDGPETFNFYIKVGEQTICHRVLDAKVFPPKIRYTVDIRQQVKTVLKDLTDIFSAENFTTEYMNYSLV
jgi:archaellum component FlaG (FlaF/FlaG flagellin family)